LVFSAPIFVLTNKEKQITMKTLQTLIIIAVLSLKALTATAGNTTPIELKFVNATTVQFKTTFVANVNETFEIQRSYDNKEFAAIGFIFGSEDATNLPAFKLNDKVKVEEKKIYYRIVKTNAKGSIEVLANSTIAIN
jgi:hypothetical protein